MKEVQLVPDTLIVDILLGFATLPISYIDLAQVSTASLFLVCTFSLFVPQANLDHVFEYKSN